MDGFGITECFASESGEVMADTAVEAFDGTRFRFGLDMHIGRYDFVVGGIVIGADMFDVE